MSFVKSTDDWYDGMDLGKLIRVVSFTSKRLLTLSNMISFVKSWNTVVFKDGI